MKQLILAAALFVSSAVAQASLPLAFQNLSLDTFLKQNDFAARGLGPLSFSIYEAGDGINLNAAGVFDAEHRADVLKPAIDEHGIAQLSQDMSKQGYSPKSISVAVPSSSNEVLLFSVIYHKLPSATVSVWGVNDQKWDVQYAKWVKESGYRISDYVQWPENGENRRSVTVVKDGQPAMYVFDVTRDQFATAGKKLDAAGWEMDNFHVSLTVDNKLVFSGIWLRKTGAGSVYYFNIDANTYKQHYNELIPQGTT